MKTYDISVSRTSWGSYEFTIQAENEEQAKELALLEAKNHHYTGTKASADYDIDYILEKLA